MSFLTGIFEFILHIDTHLGEIISSYGVLTHLVLFFIIFAETGFVFTPFLPGDSVLFAAGAFAALGSLHLTWLLIILFVAAFLGDTVNYWVGHFLGQKIVDNPKVPFINQEHIDRTQKFYEKHGGKAIFLARFVPIIRTFAPFVAGVGKMHYGKFISYNILGGFFWVFGFTLGGYFFGNIPQVRNHFSFVVLMIILISVLPIGYEFFRTKLSKQKK